MRSVDKLLAGLRAAGEQTRLRILALCARGELSVSELVSILGQSQPRVSRHLKLMVDAGLLERLPDGAQVFFCLSTQSEVADLAGVLVSLIPESDATLNRDLTRLQQVLETRARSARDYFQQVAKSWDTISSLHVPQQQLEDTLLEVVGSEAIDDLLDIGTGTGRVLEILANRFSRGIGVDLSSGMLSVARTNLDRAGLTQAHVRKGDMYRLPLDDASFDLAVLHLVLHYSDNPAEVIREASRVLRAGGRLIIVDFAAHAEDYLRRDFNHRRLGFSDGEIERYFAQAGVAAPEDTRQLVGDPLTIKIWQAKKTNALKTAGPRVKLVRQAGA